MAKQTYTYVVEMFDKNHIRPNMMMLVSNCENATDAKSLAREKLLERARRDARLVTDGMAASAFNLHKVDKDGNAYDLACQVHEVSPAYYDYLVLQCWGFAMCKRQDDVSKGVSSDSAIAKADAALKKNWDECEHESQGDSSVTRRKKRWTAEQKREAKAKRLAAKAAKAAKIAERKGLSLVA